MKYLLFLILLNFISIAIASEERPFENPDTFALVRANSIDSLPPNKEFQFNCGGPIDVVIDGLDNYRIRYSFQAPEAECVEIFDHDFSNVDPVADIPIKLDDLNDLRISNMQGSSQTVLEMIIFREQKEPPEVNNCGDPGSGVFIPTEECPGLVIFDGATGSDTRVASCVGTPDALPFQCPVRTVVGHTVYAKRLTLPDLGINKEKFGMLQVTTINTMAGANLGPYKNVIISFSKIPGDFNPENSHCSDITAAESSSVFIIQDDSDIALENPGKHCTFEPNIPYYVNTRFDAGLSDECGKAVGGQLPIICTYDIVERLVEGS